MLVVSGVLALVGLMTLFLPRLHRVLGIATAATYAAVAVHLVAVIVVLATGNAAGLVLTLGYLLASVALLPLLGIGRLGTPEAAAGDADPDRPVLAPDQIARVDGGAAVVIAITLAVLAWRVLEILEAGA
ncbi:hypothetical protein [Demequina pelophila]|uniref:hypothetical protein n=1 Tax=Demequina pelophila TaxID=1638984 RepID=UPI0012E0168F|nr:hypothetical protein [Demequina pelophila]